MRHWLATQGRRCLRSVAAQPREQVVTHIAKNPAALVPAVRSTLCARSASDTLLFSISKDLPRDVLQQLVACLTEAPQHVGSLNGSLDGVPGTPYSVSLASIPRSLATPFRSNIPGAPRIAVGRWPEQKEIWRTNPHKRTDHLESTGHWHHYGAVKMSNIKCPQNLKHCLRAMCAPCSCSATPTLKV